MICIILDSTLLHGRVNLETSDMSFILNRAKNLEANIYLGAGVRQELIEGIRETYSNLEVKFKNLNKEFDRFKVTFNAEPIDVDHLVTEFTSYLDNFCQKNQISHLKFSTSRPNDEELFAIAAQKKPPFDRQGQSFRDAMIWYSVKQFTEENPDKEIVLYIEDDSANKNAIQLGHTQTNLSVYKLEDLKKYLDKISEDKYKKINEKLSELLKKDLNSQEHLLNIQNKIKEDAQFEKTTLTNSPLGFSVSKLISVNELKIDEVDNVEIIDVDERIRFSAFAYGDLDYTLEGRQWDMPTFTKRLSPIKVGTVLSNEPAGNYLLEPTTKQFFKSLGFRISGSCEAEGNKYKNIRIDSIDKPIDKRSPKREKELNDYVLKYLSEKQKT